MISYDIRKTPVSKINKKASYYVKVSRSSVISFENVKKRLSTKCTLSEGDISAVIEELSHLFIQSFQEGNSVHIDGIGNFSVKIQTPIKDNPKAINASHIKLTGINFRPERKLINSTRSAITFKHEERSSSLPIGRDEMILKLRTYLTDKKEDIFTCKDFQYLCNLTKSTALRRLNELCKAEKPVIAKQGRANSGIYIATEALYK